MLGGFIYKFGSIQKKVLLILLGGVALGMSSSPRQQSKVFRTIKRDWSQISRDSLNRSIRSLSKHKLVEEKTYSDGSVKLVLTKEGRRQARKLSLLGGSINCKYKKKWDDKWRVVLFDVPEKDRVFRNILRSHLKELNFFKLQHSVFVSPFPVEKMIQELTRLYSAELYVRVITATKIDNEKELKKHFFQNKNTA
ncbi:MAG: hypothetical protein OEV93_03795 [Candidatus Moranbacteria bacterium]|nr:hypothetical protein [Candidatus Moranbacteria bacterium]